jgi:hypothetical protein
VYCLINLAVADMLYGVLSVTSESIFIGRYLGLTYLDWKLMVFTSFTYTLAVVTSLVSLVVVSLERVYATLFPFRHRTTRLRTYIVVFVITWLLPLPLVITFHFLPGSNVHSYSIIGFSVLFLLCLIMICTSYAAIFVKVKIKAKQIPPNHQQTAAIRITQRREQYLAMTLFIVTLLSLITWLPFNIYLIIIWLTRNVSPYNVIRLVNLLQLTNSIINPIIYVFRMRDFRKALSQLLFRCSRDRPQPIHHIAHHGNQCREQQPPTELHVM